MPVSILMYHMVTKPQSDTEARLCRTPADFRRDMEQIRAAGYEVLSLKEVLDGLSGKRNLPERATAITFDDGVACVLENALPILQEFGYPSTAFIVSGLVGQHNAWVDAMGLPRRRMLTRIETRALAAAGVDVGSHSVNHLWLENTQPDVVLREIRDSKTMLEDMTGQPVLHFAYPFGSWNEAVRRAVIDAGYSGACSTIPGRTRRGADPFLLCRSEIKGRDAPWQFRAKLKFATNSMPPTSDARRVVRLALRKWRLGSPQTL